jgi:hypothetical protein
MQEQQRNAILITLKMNSFYKESDIIISENNSKITNNETHCLLRFEVSTVVKIHVDVLWVITSCSLVGEYYYFGGIYCLCIQDTS